MLDVIRIRPSTTFDPASLFRRWLRPTPPQYRQYQTQNNVLHMCPLTCGRSFWFQFRLRSWRKASYLARISIGQSSVVMTSVIVKFPALWPALCWLYMMLFPRPSCLFSFTVHCELLTKICIPFLTLKCSFSHHHTALTDSANAHSSSSHTASLPVPATSQHVPSTQGSSYRADNPRKPRTPRSEPRRHGSCHQLARVRHQA